MTGIKLQPSSACQTLARKGTNSYNSPPFTRLPEHKKSKKEQQWCSQGSQQFQSVNSEINAQHCGPLAMVKWYDK
jgi:hypothetical protein